MPGTFNVLNCDQAMNAVDNYSPSAYLAAKGMYCISGDFIISSKFQTYVSPFAIFYNFLYGKSLYVFVFLYLLKPNIY